MRHGLDLSAPRSQRRRCELYTVRPSQSEITYVQLTPSRHPYPKVLTNRVDKRVVITLARKSRSQEQSDLAPPPFACNDSVPNKSYRSTFESVPDMPADIRSFFAPKAGGTPKAGSTTAPAQDKPKPKATPASTVGFSRACSGPVLSGTLAEDCRAKTSRNR